MYRVFVEHKESVGLSSLEDVNSYINNINDYYVTEQLIKNGFMSLIIPDTFTLCRIIDEDNAHKVYKFLQGIHNIDALNKRILYYIKRKIIITKILNV